MDLVTGASGFLGGRLAQILAGRGNKVRILDRKGALPGRLAGLGIEVVKGDLSDLAALRSAVKGVARIFNCAGCSTDWAPWKSYFDANVGGVENLLATAAAEPTLQRFLHVSTTDVYGYPDSACDESAPLKDTGLPYNRSKIMGERKVWEAARNGLPVTIVRPATIYGPGSKDAVAEVAKLLREGGMVYISGGKSKAGAVYIDDVIEAMVLAASSQAAIGQAYNISPPAEDVTWKEYIEALASGLKTGKPRFSLPFHLAYAVGMACEAVQFLLRADSRPLISRHAVLLFSKDQGYISSKAVRDFGFRPNTGLSEGIRLSVAWLDSQR